MREASRIALHLLCEIRRFNCRPSQMESPNAQQILSQFKQLQATKEELIAKMQELQNERVEASLVIKTLSQTDKSRRAYRNIGGVLVESTVEEVLPAVQNQLEGVRLVDFSSQCPLTFAFRLTRQLRCLLLNTRAKRRRLLSSKRKTTSSRASLATMKRNKVLSQT